MLLLIGSIRADIGTENIYVAGIQRFERNDSRDSFSKGKTFLYGCLAPYQRIEAWWSQLRRVYADWCMQHFQELRESGLYCDSNTIIHIELDFVTWNLCTYHLLPPDSVLGGIPSGTQGWYNFVIFFSRGEEGSLVLETTTMDHGGILARFVRGRQGKKCFTWYPGRRVKMIKKNLQKMGYICLLFLPMKRKYYTLIWQ